MKTVRLVPVLLAGVGASLAVTAGSLISDTVQLVAPAFAEAPKPAASKPVPAKAPAPAAAAPASRSEVELVNDLAKRRLDLENRTRKLELRERLLDAAEKRLDSKMADMRKLEASLKELTAARDTQTGKQMASLVKMYETMKAKDAAKIFERLDLQVQLAVATRMKEMKMAAIMADMSPDAAKDLTSALAGRARQQEASAPAPSAPARPAAAKG